MHYKYRTTMTKIIWSHTLLQAANTVICNLLAIPKPLWSFSLPTVLQHLSPINLGNYYTSGIGLLSLQQQALSRVKDNLKSLSDISWHKICGKMRCNHYCQVTFTIKICLKFCPWAICKKKSFLTLNCSYLIIKRLWKHFYRFIFHMFLCVINWWVN